MKSKTNRHRNRGALAAVGTILIFSALTRVGESAGQALATEFNGNVPVDASAETDMRSTDSMSALLTALQKRDAELAEKETFINERATQLAEAESRIKEKLQELRDAEAALRETLAVADGAAEKDVARLVAVYENMKAKDASKLFEAMEPSFAAGFLARMKPTSAAEIMSGLPPDSAYSISVELAGRHTSVPKD